MRITGFPVKWWNIDYRLKLRTFHLNDFRNIYFFENQRCTRRQI